jgi:hypothetical protein
VPSPARADRSRRRVDVVVFAADGSAVAAGRALAGVPARAAGRTFGRQAARSPPCSRRRSPQLAAGYTACVRPVDHLRQGPDAARGRAARCRPGQRHHGRARPAPLQAPDLCRQCDRHGRGSGRQTVVATVRSASFEAAAAGRQRRSKRSCQGRAAHAHALRRAASRGSSDGPTCRPPRSVVSGGRALGSADNFKISMRSPTSSAPQSALRAPPSTPAMCPTTCRSARPARSSRRSCTWHSAFRARSST